ncbi:hypothetical protein XAPC_1948 [Xanthomonas citri pv. punicae str. LMG 859]|nr:hypothetical protein XAPC_1948 [Xanthomonas citri pv. punicae str. LMG 859]
MGLRFAPDTAYRLRCVAHGARRGQIVRRRCSTALVHAIAASPLRSARAWRSFPLVC